MCILSNPYLTTRLLHLFPRLSTSTPLPSSAGIVLSFCSVTSASFSSHSFYFPSRTTTTLPAKTRKSSSISSSLPAVAAKLPLSHHPMANFLHIQTIWFLTSVLDASLTRLVWSRPSWDTLRVHVCLLSTQNSVSAMTKLWLCSGLRKLRTPCLSHC